MMSNVYAATQLNSLWQEMINIILTNSTARQSAIEQVRLAREASSFSASIVFGYAEKASSDTPKGADVRLQVQIPLWGGARDAKKAKIGQARLNVNQVEMQIETEFRAQLDNLVLLYRNYLSYNTMYELSLDELKYRRQMVKEKTLKPENLWQYARISKQSEVDSREKYVAFQSKLNSIALAFGADFWQDLKILMFSYIKSFPSSPDKFDGG